MLAWRTLLALAASLVLSGCAVNQYAKFYQPWTGARSVGSASFSGTPQVLRSSGDMNQDMLQLYVEGYAPIGSASFNGPLAASDDAIKQGLSVHASHVVILNQYQSTQSGMMPITTPTTTTAYSNGMVGSTTYSGTTTVYGTQTNYIPYSVQRFDQEAIFYAPIERAGLGVMLDNVPMETRQKVGINSGRYVVAVRRESPAFKANIVPGDVILSINDASFSSDSEAAALIRAGIGRSNKITYWRLNETKTVDVVIPTTW